MTRFRAMPPLLSAVVLLAGLGAPVAAQADDGGRLAERVLFIGNSHTARNGGLDWLVGNMVASEDPPRPYEGDARTASGVTLEYHYRNGAPWAIRTGHYDAVVLQGYLPGWTNGSAAGFLEYARKLHAIVEATGARTVLFMTWPQGRYNWAQLDDFVAAHRQMEAELSVPVAPVGVAFANAGRERPDLALIGEDGVHATWEGAYLAAATVYATLFDRTPEGLPYAFGVREEDAAFLQRTAWQTLIDWRRGVPPSDQTSLAVTP